MTLLDAVKNIDITYQELLDDILMCVQDRLDWLEEREPESEGITHDEWDDKYSDWEDITEIAEELVSQNDRESRKRSAQQLKEKIEDFQLFYRGISKLKI